MEKFTLDPVTFTAEQLQAIIASGQSQNAVKNEKLETYANRWRIAEAKVKRLERENRKLREKRSFVRSLRTLVNWASKPSKKEKEFTFPGFGMDLTVFGLLVLSGMAFSISSLV